jgi:hypothetical protein
MNKMLCTVATLFLFSIEIVFAQTGTIRAVDPTHPTAYPGDDIQFNFNPPGEGPFEGNDNDPNVHWSNSSTHNSATHVWSGFFYNILKCSTVGEHVWCSRTYGSGGDGTAQMDMNYQEYIEVVALPSSSNITSMTKTALSNCTSFKLDVTFNGQNIRDVGVYWQFNDPNGTDETHHGLTYTVSTPGRYYPRIMGRGTQTNSSNTSTTTVEHWANADANSYIEVFNGIAAPTFSVKHVFSFGTAEIYITNPAPSGEFSELYNLNGSIPTGFTTFDQNNGIYKVPLVADQTATYKVRQKGSDGCWSGYSNVTVASEPNPAIDKNLDYIADGIPVILQPTLGWDGVTWYSVDENGTATFVGSGFNYIANDPGTYYARVSGPNYANTGQSNQVEVDELDDDFLNWIETKSFDMTDPDHPIADSRNYFDLLGKPAQMQSKVFGASLGSSDVLATGAIPDKFGRPALVTLPAPINNSEFQFGYRFVGEDDDRAYNYSDLDGLMGNSISQNAGQVGWYYSVNNNVETNVPKTIFPYSRIDYYEDGSDNLKRTAGAGEQFRMGNGKEVLTGKFPVYNDLVPYYQTRLAAFPLLNTPLNSLKRDSFQEVTRDVNGKYNVMIKGGNGVPLLSGFYNPTADATYTITNSATADASDPLNKSLTFYLLSDQNVVQSSAGTYMLTNLVTESHTATLSSLPSPLPAGFYRIDMISGTLGLQWETQLCDVMEMYYDNSMRLIMNISPNGVKQLKDGVSISLIDKTTYTYNFRGEVITSTEPDAGTTNYVYRKDGSIRYSQNAEQAQGLTSPPRCSYTHYDDNGRPVESGEYVGDGANDFLQMRLELEVTYPNLDPAFWPDDNSTRKDWIRTHYDVPATLSQLDNAVIPGTRKQTFIANAVSWTENKYNKTYYSYDEQGRVTWIIQRPQPVDIPGGGTFSPGLTFVTDYQYDRKGNVTSVRNSTVNSSGEDPSSVFYHHYEYDANRRLSIVSTSRDGVTKTQRAKYIYYLHGPLKRIELGDKLQGIDFVYSLQGWITQINHPDNGSDPGKDGDTGAHSDFKKDVFGMVLDYYESALQNLFISSNIRDQHNPWKIHKVPGLDDERQYGLAQNFSMKEMIEMNLRDIKKARKGNN